MASVPGSRQQTSSSAEFSQRALSTLIAYRVELLFVAIPIGIYAYLRTYLHARTIPVAVAAGLFVVGILLLPYTRRRLFAARVRRSWERAARVTGLRHTTVRSVEKIPVGTRLEVGVRGGHSVESIGERRAALAAELEVREVRVVRGKHAGRARVTLVTRDPLSVISMLHWPGLGPETTSYWDPIPVALDEDGESVDIDGARKSILIGGTTGFGKSVLVNMLASWAARDPSVKIYAIDGKRVELRHWSGVAERFVSDPDQALDVLAEVNTEIDRRADWLANQSGIRLKLEPEDGFGPIVVVIDELADFTLRAPKKQQGADFDSALGAIAAKGRFVAVSAIASTQVPYVNVISGGTRNNFPLSIAFWCKSAEQSRAILGGDSGVDASRLPKIPGRCLVAAEDGGWKRAATFLNAPADLERLVELAERARSVNVVPIDKRLGAA